MFQLNGTFAIMGFETQGMHLKTLIMSDRKPIYVSRRGKSFYGVSKQVRFYHSSAPTERSQRLESPST